MKKIQLLVIVALVFFMASCQKNKDVQFYNLGSEFFISSPGYSSLDNEAAFSINNQNKNLSEIDISNLGGLIYNASGDSLVSFTSSYKGKIPITGGKGSITVSDANLGINLKGESAKFDFNAVYNGKPFSRYFTLDVMDPISVSYPTILHRDTTYYFHFTIAPVTATVDAVTAQIKSQGVTVSFSGLNADDSIPVKGSDYNVGDTLFIKVAGTAGNKTASTITNVIIKPNSYSKLATFKLDSTSNRAFDLVGDSAVMTGDATADIELAHKIVAGGYTLGFSSPQSAVFVKGSAADYAIADKADIAATDFSSAIKTNYDVSVGDVYIFKTMRGTKTYYGVMKVTKIVKPQGVLDNSYITIEYKH